MMKLPRARTPAGVQGHVLTMSATSLSHLLLQSTQDAHHTVLRALCAWADTASASASVPVPVPVVPTEQGAATDQGAATVAAAALARIEGALHEIKELLRAAVATAEPTESPVTTATEADADADVRAQPTPTPTAPTAPTAPAAAEPPVLQGCAARRSTSRVGMRSTTLGYASLDAAAE